MQYKQIFCVMIIFLISLLLKIQTKLIIYDKIIIIFFFFKHWLTSLKIYLIKLIN